MRLFCDDNAPKMGRRLKVGANFIRKILSTSPYKSIFNTQHAADFVNLDVEGDLDLSRLDLPTLLFDSVEESSVSFDKSNIKGPTLIGNAIGARTDGDRRRALSSVLKPLGKKTPNMNAFSANLERLPNMALG
jgi:hypothetical protein